jgi:hypothetical protein
MIEKLQEILGLISGYKQKYDAIKAELDKANAMIVQAEPIVNDILAIARGLSGTDTREAK